MKRMIAALLLVVAMLSMLASCGEPFTCDTCKEEKTGGKHTTEILGQEVVICDDCYKEMEDAANALKDAFK